MRTAAYLVDLHDALNLAEHTLAAQGSQAQLVLVPGEPVILQSAAETVSGALPAVVHGLGPVPRLSTAKELPLFNTADPLDGMLALLYRGVAAGHHWLALTPADGAATVVSTVHSIRSGADDNARMIPAAVAIEDLGPFDAMIPKGYTWNGWDLPSFDLPTVEQIAAQVARQQQDPDYTTRIDIDGTTVTVVEQAGTAEQTCTVLSPDHDGRYPVGSGWWTWQARTTAAVRELPPPARRLWFPWARVAALVAHADHTDTHGKVTYPDGRDSSGRGLILRYHPGGATLASSGLPGWHDRWGRPHTVADRPIRPVNRPPVADDRTRSGFIRLRDSFYNLVPSSRIPDRQDGWLAVDVWHDLPGLDGVPITRCARTVVRDDFDPGRHAWIDGKVFSWDLSGQDWPAQIAPGLRCGLGYVARFDAATAAAIAADTAAYADLPGKHWIEIHHGVVELYRTGGHDQRNLLVSWTVADSDGMYAVGLGHLVWHLAESAQPGS
ncbi:hypothetical protein Cs7R123_32030 [Catellatospora sp. TT07R-123]|uniref:hypothetical protein n=1 Tax=Catellatospora sp. TT07R-123 TaxID=2733863 RepID=UPI001B2E73B3|nr:hypothetical protein [Catellatospora sp. TT07R-123]GHJ45861.1 hypothetical protein Cs7R123_32030 [Catellatospora sp. TT07R-123]